jgi:hypothetical protein
MRTNKPIHRPAPDEAAPYYFTYIDKVPDGDVRELLVTQRSAVQRRAQTITDVQSLERYAPGKWSIREVMNHLADCERLFLARAFWFARGFDSPLPSFDQQVAVAAARADETPWADLVADFDAARASTISFFNALPPAVWDRRGVASDNPFTVRALAYIAVGHVTHHLATLEERYGLR